MSREEQHVQDHDNSGKPEREEVQHTVQENHHLERRDTVDQFDLATDDTNIDFSVSGIPEETVKRSETMNVLELIRRITRHPQKQAVQNDLDRNNRSMHSALSRRRRSRNQETSRYPRSSIRSRSCNASFALIIVIQGIIYCVCGRLMAEDSAENRKYMSSTLDSFSIANFYIRKDRPRGHRYGKAPGCKEYTRHINLQRNVAKRGTTASMTGTSATRPSGAP